jgi:hypothetical protein
MEMRCVKYVTNCNVFILFKLNAIYQQGGYIPHDLQNSRRKHRTENQVRKSKLIFVVLDASHVRLFYQPRFFLILFEHEDNSN